VELFVGDERLLKMDPLAVGAFPMLAFYCPRVHGAQHVTPRHPRGVARLPGGQRRTPAAAIPPSPRPPGRWSTPASTRRGRWAGALGTGAAAIENALLPALRAGLLGGQRRVGRHVRAAG
jgi:hypothetical protein